MFVAFQLCWRNNPPKVMIWNEPGVAASNAYTTEKIHTSDRQNSFSFYTQANLLDGERNNIYFIFNGRLSVHFYLIIDAFLFFVPSGFTKMN